MRSLPDLPPAPGVLAVPTDVGRVSTRHSGIGIPVGMNADLRRTISHPRDSVLR
jgi:hypothetical protein